MCSNNSRASPSDAYRGCKSASMGWEATRIERKKFYKNGAFSDNGLRHKCGEATIIRKKAAVITLVMEEDQSRKHDCKI